MTTIAGGLGIYADDANTTNPRVSVTTFVNKHSHSVATVDRAEFLDAVANELDVIITPRSDLPTPVPHPTNPDLAYVRTLTASRGRTAQSPDVLMDRALDYIAAAEWAAAEPPVDEAQVNALAELVRQADESEGLVGDELDDAYHRTIARHLVKSGVRAPEAGDQQ